MAPLSFLKSSSSTSTPANLAPSPGRSSQTRNSSPSPEPSSTSRYNPARLLRRKASLSHKTSSQAVRTSSDLQPVPALVHGSEPENSEHETEEPRTASSAFFSDIGDPPSSSGHGGGIGLGLGGNNYVSSPGFGMVGDDARMRTVDDGPSRTFGSPRSPRSKRDGGIWSGGGGGTILMDSIPDYPPTQSPNRATFLDMATTTPTTSSSRRIMDPAELFLEDSTDTVPSTGPSRHLGRPVTPPVPPLDHPFYPTALSPPRRPMPKSPRPSSRSTPPLQPPQLVSSSSFSVFPPTGSRPRHVASPSLDSKTSITSGSGGPMANGNGNGNGNGPVVNQQDDPEPDYGSRRPTVTAEWLARKPSSSTSRLGRKNSTGANMVNRAASPIFKRKTSQRAARSSRQTNLAAEAGTDSDSPGVSQDSDADPGPSGAFTGVVGKRRSISARDGYEVEVSCDDSQWPGPEDEAGELVWKVKIRRQPKGKGNMNGAVSSNNGSSGHDGQPDHMVPSTVAPSSPLQLSSGQSRATAPGTASSINLSLSLDQPTGKLVFIAFPMDLHATPRRRGSNAASAKRLAGGPPTPPLPPSPRDLFFAGPASSTTIPIAGISESSTSGLAAPLLPINPRVRAPSTPPQPPLVAQPSTPQSRSSSRLDRPEYPVTPTRVRSSGQFSPSGQNGTGSGGYTSPRSRGTTSSVARSLSPAFSGTPGSTGHGGYLSPGAYTHTHGTPTGSAARRIKLVSAPDLEGGLYAPGTIDCLSEELESTSIGER